MKKDTENFLPEHSKIKIELLNRYLDRYLGIICNDGYTQRIRVYDLFCSKGLYGSEDFGSPLVILKCIKQVCFAQKAKGKPVPKIDVYFNDKNIKKVEILKQNVSELNLHYSEFGALTFTANDYQDEAHKVITLLPSLKNEKVFLFIDPFGYKFIKASQIKAIMGEKNAEVLLFLPTQFMYRFDGARPVALQDFISEIVDINVWKPNSSIFLYIEQIKEGFRKFMGPGYFVDTFTIQKEPQTAFCLFFFSSHIRGFEKMLESKWEIDTAEGRGWKYERSGHLFAQDRNELEDSLLGFLKEAKTNSELFAFTLSLGFLPKHINEVLTALQQENRIIVIKSDGAPARKGAFYISYDNYKHEPERITIKLS
jgi:three-Cys-motif partner protein